MLKTLGTIITVVGCFIAGIATLVAGYWLGIIVAVAMGALSVIAIVFGVVSVIVYTIIEAVTMEESPSEPDKKDGDE